MCIYFDTCVLKGMGFKKRRSLFSFCGKTVAKPPHSPSDTGKTKYSIIKKSHNVTGQKKEN